MINTTRLQLVLDEMAQWEQEVFEKEYADVNWYKGKQREHVKQLENGKKQNGLGESCLDSSKLFTRITPSHPIRFRSINEESTRSV